MTATVLASNWPKNFAYIMMSIGARYAMQVQARACKLNNVSCCTATALKTIVSAMPVTPRVNASLNGQIIDDHRPSACKHKRRTTTTRTCSIMLFFASCLRFSLSRACLVSSFSRTLFSSSSRSFWIVAAQCRRQQCGAS